MILSPDSPARLHRLVREPEALAHFARHARHPRSDKALRLGVRNVARRPGRLRLSLGGGVADPDLAWIEGPRRHPGRGDRQQRTGFSWRAGGTGHRDHGGCRRSVAGVVPLDRNLRRCSRPAAIHCSDAAQEIKTLNRRLFWLHPLRGELKRPGAVAVRANWRNIFASRTAGFGSRRGDARQGVTGILNRTLHDRKRAAAWQNSGRNVTGPRIASSAARSPCQSRNERNVVSSRRTLAPARTVDPVLIRE
jgi:hypothetical protein